MLLLKAVATLDDKKNIQNKNFEIYIFFFYLHVLTYPTNFDVVFDSIFL